MGKEQSELDRHALKDPEAERRRGSGNPETAAYNSVFATHNEGQGERGGKSLTDRVTKRGYSSAGRAVALQAIGQGFESPYLHQLLKRFG